MGRVFWGGVLITGHSCNRVPELSAAASSCPVSADAPRSHDTPRTSSRTFGGDSDSSSDPPGGAGAQPRAVRRGVYCLYLSCGLSIWSESVGGTFRGRGLWGDYISHKATVRSAPSLGPEVATTSAFQARQLRRRPRQTGYETEPPAELRLRHYSSINLCQSSSCSPFFLV